VIDADDKKFFVMTIVAPVVAWWLLIGRKKYGIKGMTQR
jgi:hypothetical protein